MVITEAPVTAAVKDFGSQRFFVISKDGEEIQVYRSAKEPNQWESAKKLKVGDIVTVELFPLDYSIGGREGTKHFLVSLNS